MSIPIAYLTVVLVWSTTPLGIFWSSESINPTMAVLLRMLIAVFVGAIILKVFNITLPSHKRAQKLYVFSAIGVFGGMLFSYLASQHIPTGMVSLVFGLSPLISGFLAPKILGEAKLTLVKKLAMFIAFSGLFAVLGHSLQLSNTHWLGIVFILIAVCCFSLSGVLVKSVAIVIHPAATTVGTLLVSIPLFSAVWWFTDGTLPIENWTEKSLLAVAYLGFFGSLIGFFAYFYVLQKLPASTVSLITMITPILAISLGNLLNNEPVTFELIIGACLVTSGLAIYQWGGKLLRVPMSV